MSTYTYICKDHPAYRDANGITCIEKEELFISNDEWDNTTILFYGSALE